MNEEFEKYWKSSRASDRPFAETNAQILDKMIAKTHFLAGAAAMREKAIKLAIRDDTVSCFCADGFECEHCATTENIAAAIRKLEVE